MDASSALDVAQQGIQVALMVSMPGLALTLFLGLAVSVFQAVTQVQEMTLTYVPKVLGMAILLTLMGNWMLQKLVAYTTFCLEQASRVG
jgi:flagellar biosynthetic protein FliQ